MSTRVQSCPPSLEDGWRAAWAWGIGLALAQRLGLGLFMAAVWVSLRPSLPPQNPAAFDGLPLYGSLAGEALLGVWLRWDAIHHLNLARLGYAGVSVGDTVYYPLFAGLVRAVSMFTGDLTAAGLLISTVCTAAALACLYRLVQAAYGEATARWTVVALAAYPTAFFLAAPYTEALFLALTLGAFVAARAASPRSPGRTGGRWGWAGVLGALSSLTRGPGLLLTPALLWLAWTQRRAEVRRWLPALFGALLPAAAGAGFGLWRAWAGFPPMDQVLRAYSGLELVDPLRGLFFAVVQWARVRDFQTTLDLASAGLFLGLGAALLVNPRWRRGEWLLFSGAHLWILLSKHSLTAASLQSLARYVLALFPGFIVLGDWLSHRGPRVRFAWVLASGGLQLVFSALYALWWFIG